MRLRNTVRGLFTAGFLLLPAVFASSAQALSLNDSSDTYSQVADDALNAAYAKVLADDGESTTGKFFAFNMLGCSPSQQPDGAPATAKAAEGTVRNPVYIHAVQDRGQPRGGEYPTFVFTSGHDPRKPDLEFKLYAGKRLYLSDVIVCEPDRCLLSAQQGMSDVCLADPFGNPAPDIPGLRNDFWSRVDGWLRF
ncbi:hypothetical protein FMN50_13345 [Rhodobacterales bacterium]|nr:hypothetical protein FMN50_13345 [Rhodobacterales bacterium]